MQPRWREQLLRLHALDEYENRHLRGPRLRAALDGLGNPTHHPPDLPIGRAAASARLTAWPRRVAVPEPEICAARVLRALELRRQPPPICASMWAITCECSTCGLKRMTSESTMTRTLCPGGQ